MKEYQLVFPDDFAFSLKMQDEEFAQEIKKLALIKLFEIGKISSGKAAKALGMSRTDFLNILHAYKVSVFNDYSIENLLQDKENA
jgi:predicted HTH domain antitoxin